MPVFKTLIQTTVDSMIFLPMTLEVSGNLTGSNVGQPVWTVVSASTLSPGLLASGSNPQLGAGFPVTRNQQSGCYLANLDSAYAAFYEIPVFTRDDQTYLPDVTVIFDPVRTKMSGTGGKTQVGFKFWRLGLSSSLSASQGGPANTGIPQNFLITGSLYEPTGTMKFNTVLKLRKFSGRY